MNSKRRGRRKSPPQSAALFRNPAAGADITAFTMSHSVEVIICPTHRNIVFLHIKQEFFPFWRGGLRPGNEIDIH
jgi:hypothetical protein